MDTHRTAGGTLARRSACDGVVLRRRSARRDAPQLRKNVLWIAQGAAEIAKSLGVDESTVRLTIAISKRELLAARKPRPTPFIDKTMYVSWNAMFVSTYFNAARVLEGELAANSGAFALKTIDRMLREAWSEENGFAHRIGGPALRGSLDDQVFGVLALLDAYEATLDAKYFRAAQRTMDLAIEKYGDAENGGFFDRASDAPAMGGLEVRRKPFQDSRRPAPTPSPRWRSRACTRTRTISSTSTGQKKTLEAFAGIAPQYGPVRRNLWPGSTPLRRAPYASSHHGGER